MSSADLLLMQIFKDRGSRATATTKMELCDQFTLYVGFFETKTIVLVAEARALYGVQL